MDQNTKNIATFMAVCAVTVVLTAITMVSANQYYWAHATPGDTSEPAATQVAERVADAKR